MAIDGANRSLSILHTRGRCRGDIDAMSLWAGQSVGLESKPQSAADIVREIADEAKVILRRLAH